jgi:hypothetical protein
VHFPAHNAQATAFAESHILADFATAFFFSALAGAPLDGKAGYGRLRNAEKVGHDGRSDSIEKMTAFLGRYNRFQEVEAGGLLI